MGGARMEHGLRCLKFGRHGDDDVESFEDYDGQGEVLKENKLMDVRN